MAIRAITDKIGYLAKKDPRLWEALRAIEKNALLLGSIAEEQLDPTIITNITNQITTPELSQTFITADNEPDLPGGFELEAGTNVTLTRTLVPTRKLRINVATGVPQGPGALIGGRALIAGAAYTGIFGSQNGANTSGLCLPEGGFIQNHGYYVTAACGQGVNVYSFFDSAPTSIAPGGAIHRYISSMLVVLPQDTGVVVNSAPAFYYPRGDLLSVYHGQQGTPAGVVRSWSAEFICDGGFALIGNSFAGTIPGVTASSTLFGSFFHGNNATTAWITATEGPSIAVVPIDGVLSKLTIVIGTQQPASGSLVITIRHNGADSALTVTIPLSGGSGSFDTVWTDFTNTVSVSAGDTIAIEFVNNATATSAVIRSVCLLLEPTTESSRLIGAHINSTFAATNYSTPLCLSFSTTQANQEWPCPRSGIIKKLRCYISTGATGTLTLTLMHNGVASTLTGSSSASASGVINLDLTNEVTVAAGDYISMRIAVSGTSPTLASWSAEWAEAV